MGADMITVGFWTPDPWKWEQYNDPEVLSPLVAEALVDEVLLESYWKNNTPDLWPGAEDDEVVQPPRERTVAGIVETLQVFFDNVDNRDVNQLRFVDPATGVAVWQWLTGGMSWGDMPTAASQAWHDLFQVEVLVPTLLRRLGIYDTPFEVVEAAA